MKKIIFLEGLPGVGKTTIANSIKKIGRPDVHVVDEIIKEDIINNVSDNEKDYMINDEMKIKKYEDGLIVIDRGPISTLSYNQTRKIIDEKFDANPVIEWFKSVEYIYQENIKIIFLTNKGKNFKITSDNQFDPYGGIENQRLLESITLFNCLKYSKDVIVREYYQDNMEDVINEIIN